MLVKFGLKGLMFLLPVSLTIYLLLYHMVTSEHETGFEKAVRISDEERKLLSTMSTRPALRNSRALPKALQTFLNSSLPPFLQDYKNPCWYNGPRLNCLPYFHLVGVTKCGTTTLYEQICKHPQVLTVGKENHWIARRQFQGSALQPLSKYIDLFGKGTIGVQNYVMSGFHSKVFGDCTATTIWENYYYRLTPSTNLSLNLQEPIFTNAEYIYHLNPATKILAIIRNPVDRLFSGYMFYEKSSYSLEGFDTYARDLISQHRKCLQKSSLRACVYKPYGVEVMRIRIGIYHIHLKDFFAVFPRNQVMVVKLEDFSQNMVNVLREVYSFLDLEPMSESGLNAGVEWMSEKPRNQRKPERQNLGDMWNSTRQLLYEFYKPYNEELVKLLGLKFDYN